MRKEYTGSGERMGDAEPPQVWVLAPHRIYGAMLPCHLGRRCAPELTTRRVCVACQVDSSVLQ